LSVPEGSGGLAGALVVARPAAIAMSAMPTSAVHDDLFIIDSRIGPRMILPTDMFVATRR
jgi:hypothetical protein